jgi:hypothetical protein
MIDDFYTVQIWVSDGAVQSWMSWL